MCERDVEHAEGSLNRCVVCEQGVCAVHTSHLHYTQQQKGYDVCVDCRDDDDLNAQYAQGVARAKRRSDPGTTGAADRAPDTQPKAPARKLPTTRTDSRSPRHQNPQKKSRRSAGRSRSSSGGGNSSCSPVRRKLPKLPVAKEIASAGIHTDNCESCGGKPWPREMVVAANDCQGMPKDYPADKQGNTTATPSFTGENAWVYTAPTSA